MLDQALKVADAGRHQRILRRAQDDLQGCQTLLAVDHLGLPLLWAVLPTLRITMAPPLP